jgi:hypothetical protein
MDYHMDEINNDVLKVYRAGAQICRVTAGMAFGEGQNRDVVMTDDEAFLVFCWEKIVREVDRCYDLRGSDLAFLVRACLTQNGRLTRQQLEHYQQYAPAPALELIERLTRRLIRRLGAIPRCT